MPFYLCFNKFVFGVVIAVAVLIGDSSSSYSAVVFNFLGDQGDDVDGVASGATTLGGITATLSANSGVLNKGTSNFGINSSGTNETTRIDDDSTDEILTITFSEAVVLNSFVTSGGSSATDGSYIAGLSPGMFEQISGGGAVTTSPNATIAIGQSFTIQQDAGATGFSLDSITVTAVPEPSSLLALSGLAVIGTLARRRR